MKIRIGSDFHNEFSMVHLPAMEDEDEQILILAGDIGVAQNGQRQNTIIDFLEDMSLRFKKVIYVLGNHEFYGSNYKDVHNKLYEETDHLDNVVIMQNSLIVIDDVIFVGATLWTDLCDGDTLIMNEAKRCMNDYWEIKNNVGGYRRLEPQVTVEEHHKSREYIFHIASEHRDKKVVVVSHHAPSYNSVAMRYRSGEFDMIMNYNFHSNLDEEIMANDNVALWVHGHTHTSFDYNIGETRVVCNPRGYDNKRNPAENREFNPCLVVEV